MFTVTIANITAISFGGEWVNVTGVSVDFAEYVTPGGHRYATGLHLTATISGGPHNGDAVVLPLTRVDAVRTT